MRTSIQPQADRDVAEQPTSPGGKAHSKQGDSTGPDTIRDTIESIVVAIILAFVFRAFIVEAFVIPTGSMAPSLYGKHGQYRCPMCQYTFAYGLKEASKGQGATLADKFFVRCPNCTWDGDGRDYLNQRNDKVADHSGDRILVLKWPYEIGGDWLGPQRWDVVVFKNPQDGEMNYIKRLLGLPGEVFHIINGDLYTVPIDKVPTDIVDALTLPPPQRAHERRLTSEQSNTLAGLLRIQRKTTIAQKELWLIHNDHDFIPQQQAPNGRLFDPPRWEKDATAAPRAWNAKTPVVRFDPPDDEVHWLRLKGKPIQDDCGYNNVNSTKQIQASANDVGDVRVKFVFFPGKGDGTLSLRLTKGRDQFRAQIRSDGNVRLGRLGRRGVWDERKTSRIAPFKHGTPLEIEFENLDYRVCLRIDGQEVIWTDDDKYRPDLQTLLRPPYEDGRNSRATVEIGASGAPLEIRHLQVHRDVFYRSDAIPAASPAFRNFRGWGTATNPILLRADPEDYFCCGDNSPQSQDSRYWVDVAQMLRERQPPNTYQHGTVPGDQLIGKAFFVYWPSGLRFYKQTPPVIPNFGRMRIIR